MSAHVEWLGASALAEIIPPEEGWTDAYGQGVDEGNLGLFLGHPGNSDYVVVEGTLDELREFAARVAAAVDTYQAATP